MNVGVSNANPNVAPRNADIRKHSAPLGFAALTPTYASLE